MLGKEEALKMVTTHFITITGQVSYFIENRFLSLLTFFKWLASWECMCQIRNRVYKIMSIRSKNKIISNRYFV